MNGCEHRRFEATCEVGRVAHMENLGEIVGFEADLHIECADCGAEFGFRCPDVGVLADRPSVSFDRLELRIPLLSPSEITLAREVVGMSEPKTDDSERQR